MAARFRVNRERFPLALSLMLLGFGAAATGLQFDEGLYLTVAGMAVVGVGILTLLSQGPATAVRTFDIPPAMPRIPAGVDARVAWSGEGPPPEDLRNALTRMGVTLDEEVKEESTAATRVFTARVSPKGLMTNEDDLRERGIAGTALVTRARTLGMELADRTLVELILKVHVKGKDPYTVKDLTMAPTSQLITVAAGLTVPVLIDPDDPIRLMVDWEHG